MGEFIEEALTAARRSPVVPEEDQVPLEVRNDLAERCFELVQAGNSIRYAARKIAEQSAFPVVGVQVLRWTRIRYPVDDILIATQRSAVSLARAVGLSFDLAQQRAMNTLLMRITNRRIQSEAKKPMTQQSLSELNVLALLVKRTTEVDERLDKRGAALDEGGASEDDLLSAADLL